jgi:thiosulfate/3-mercaptopyruvate sulfurtransferase
LVHGSWGDCRAAALLVASLSVRLLVPVFVLLMAAPTRSDLLVTTEWLAAHLDDPGIRVVELRRLGAEDYAQGHVPGAVFVENDAIRDPRNPPTFLPSVQAFETLMGRLGISNSTRVLAYDERGGIYAARLWWILNYFGHSNVALVDGGWTKWTREGRPVSVEPARPRPARFAARPDPRWLATAEDVLAAIDKPGIRIVDARTRAEIEGRDPRGIRRAGFIPSSVPVYWEDALDPELLTFKPESELRRLYESRGVRTDEEVIAYCQVGMRASHDLFVLRLLGASKLRNYLGSWEEWGNRDDLPIATVK